MADMADLPEELSPEILGQALAESDFLRFIFHPRTATRPTGVRKRRVTGRGKGRKAARIRAYNKFDPFKQRTIDAAGREKYLRGELSLAEARRQLRPRAEFINVARPAKVPGDSRREAIENFASQAYASQRDQPYRTSGVTAGQLKSPVSMTVIKFNVREMMTPAQRATARRMTYQELRRQAMKRGRPRLDTDSGELVEYNPFWYH